MEFLLGMILTGKKKEFVPENPSEHRKTGPRVTLKADDVK
jgi:hypothetical protein